MNVQLKIKNLLYKYQEWAYLFYLGISAILVTTKGIFIGKILNSLEFSLYSQFQLYSGLGCVIAGAGILLRCHVEFPVLIKNADDFRTKVFHADTNGALGISIIIFSILLLTSTSYAKNDFYITIFALVQAALLLIFTVDLIKIKSASKFTEYAKRLMRRNFFIFLTSIIAAYLTENAHNTTAFETGSNALISLPLILKFIKSINIPSREYLFKTLRFTPLEIMGALAQYQDRLIATTLLSKTDFSRFSYIFIIITIGITLQQFINTKLIVNFSTEKIDSAFATFKKASIFLFISITAISSIGTIIILTLKIAPSWLAMDVDIFIMAIMIAALKGADLTQSFLTCRHEKRIALKIQTAGMILIALIFVGLQVTHNHNLKPLLLSIVLWQTTFMASNLLIIYKIAKKENNAI